MISRCLIFLLATTTLLRAGTVVVTSLPDEQPPIGPLASWNGLPLPVGSVVRIGAFPGKTDDDLLNTAAAGTSALTAAFVPFGSPASVGDGADNAAGTFEISAREGIRSGESPLVGERISLLITQAGGAELLVARFNGSVFIADSDSGIEQVITLHLADAHIVVGNRLTASKLTTSQPPVVGSFIAWIDGFPLITDPAQKLPGADADGDGRSNFLEYATGGNPASGSDSPTTGLHQDNEGSLWFRFMLEPGIGSIRCLAQSSGDLLMPWTTLTNPPEPDTGEPGTWLRVRVPQPLAPNGFFRVAVDQPVSP